MKYSEEESSRLEFKREIPENNQILKTIVGFCNQKGGKLIIGVDANGKILGLKNNDIQRIMEYLNKSIYESSSPPIIPLVYVQSIADNLLLIIEVSSGMNKPYYIKSEGLERGTYIRLGRSTLRASSDIIEELKWQSRGLSYDMMPIYHASKDDFDLKRLLFFLNSRRNSKVENISDALLESYHLTVNEHSSIYPTIGGTLLFGKNVQKHLPESMIICSLFSGISGRNAISSIDCEGTLFEQFEIAYNFIIKNLEKSFKIGSNPKRQEELEVPPEAIREILLNAIVHRNYHINAPSKIAIYSNRIEFFSPGSFPGPVDINNLSTGITYIRNNVICKVFREAGFIEKLGSGFITLFSSYERAKLPKPQIIEGENYIKCILPRRSFKDYSIDDYDEEKKILALFGLTEEISISDVTKCLNVSKSTAGRRLSKLTSDKILIQIGSGKATRYRKKKL